MAKNQAVAPIMSSVEEGPLACTGIALPPALQNYTLFDPQSMAIFRENLGGEPIQISDLTKIKLPAGGATNWALPTLEGDEESVKEIQGIIVAVRTTRGYWIDEYDGAKNPPECASEDGINGKGEPGGLCLTCPQAQWDSSPKGGQACKKVQLVFLMTPGNTLPAIIAVPPGSLASMRKYLIGLSNKGIKYSSCVTSFKLTKQVSKGSKDKKGGIDYSQVAPYLVTQVPTALVGQIEAFANEYAGSFKRATISLEDAG